MSNNIKPLPTLSAATIRKLWPKFALKEDSDIHSNVNKMTSKYIEHLRNCKLIYSYTITKNEEITITFGLESKYEEKLYFTKGEYSVMEDHELVNLYSGFFDDPDKYLLWIEMKK